MIGLVSVSQTFAIPSSSPVKNRPMQSPLTGVGDTVELKFGGQKLRRSVGGAALLMTVGFATAEGYLAWQTIQEANTVYHNVVDPFQGMNDPVTNTVGTLDTSLLSEAAFDAGVASDTIEHPGRNSQKTLDNAQNKLNAATLKLVKAAYPYLQDCVTITSDTSPNALHSYLRAQADRLKDAKQVKDISNVDKAISKLAVDVGKGDALDPAKQGDKVIWLDKMQVCRAFLSATEHAIQDDETLKNDAGLKEQLETARKAMDKAQRSIDADGRETMLYLALAALAVGALTVSWIAKVFKGAGGVIKFVFSNDRLPRLGVALVVAQSKIWNLGVWGLENLVDNPEDLPVGRWEPFPERRNIQRTSNRRHPEPLEPSESASADLPPDETDEKLEPVEVIQEPQIVRTAEDYEAVIGKLAKTRLDTDGQQDLRYALMALQGFRVYSAKEFRDEVNRLRGRFDWIPAQHILSNQRVSARDIWKDIEAGRYDSRQAILMIIYQALEDKAR